MDPNFLNSSLTASLGTNPLFQSGGQQILNNPGPAPTTAPASTDTTGVLQTGGGTTAPASTAPTAAQIAASQAAAAAAAATANWNTTKNAVMGTIGGSVNTGAGDYNQSILDYLNQANQNQNTINASSVQNELSRQEGTQGVLNMVGNGIRSGGVQLSNDNAGTSSAGEALARAYGILGRQQQSSVGNQFALGQNTIAAQQKNLDANNATQIGDSQQKKADTINAIVTNAQQQLASLNYQAAISNIPDRVDIEQQIAQVKQQAMAALGQYDSELTNGIAAHGPQSPSDVMAAATNLRTAGTAPTNPFDYTTAIPTQFQDTGQFSSPLPIFVAPQNKNNTQTPVA